MHTRFVAMPPLPVDLLFGCHCDGARHDISLCNAPYRRKEKGKKVVADRRSSDGHFHGIDRYRARDKGKRVGIPISHHNVGRSDETVGVVFGDAVFGN